MAQVVLLGTAPAIPTAERDYTHLAVQAEDQCILVDCGGNPLASLARAGLDWRQLSHVVATHYHADHISGLPNLIVGMWLLGRQAPLHVHGLKETLEKIRQLLELFEWHKWNGLFPIHFNEIPEQECSLVLQSAALRVYASPGAHSVPAVGLRFESLASGRAAAYSGDTAPSPSIARLAEGAHVLIHEAAGANAGHSSARQAGEIARQANAAQLYLIHYPAPPEADPGELAAAARQVYAGGIILARDGMRISF